VLREYLGFILFLLYQLLIDIGTLVQRVPDTSQLSKWTKERPLQLIEVVVEHVAAFDELRSCCLYCQLYFAKNRFIEADIHQNVVGSTSQTVFDANYFEFFWMVFADSGYFLVDSDYFFFL
jgi:hypothetical protein